MSATIVATAAIGAVVSTGVNAAAGAIGLGGSGGSVSSSGGGGGSGQYNPTTQQYIYYGPHPGTTPMGGSKEIGISSGQISPDKAIKNRPATRQEIDSTPTQAIGTEQAKSDFNNYWGSRLSHYLDYSTRSLG